MIVYFPLLHDDHGRFVDDAIEARGPQRAQP